MKPNYKHIYKAALLVCFSFFLALSVNAQRLPHGSSRGGGSTSHKSSGHSSGQIHKSVSRPSTGTKQPSTTHNSGNRPSAGNTNNNQHNSGNKPSTGNSNHNNNKPSGSTNNHNTNNSGNRPSNNNSGNHNNDSHNNVHTGGGHNNVNVNVNVNNHYDHHSHHHTPPPRPIPSPHPPYVWGGFHITFFNPYFYFPFEPYYWDGWYPWGHIVSSVVETAIIVSAINDDGDKEDYSYDDGNFYLKTEDGFVSVAPPIGAVVPSVPKDAEVVTDGKNTYYYYGATYYDKTNKGYEVVVPAAGTVVSNLPEGAQEVKIGEQTYVVFDDIYYQPVKVNNKNSYEIVEVEED
jgi:hypothetical protein